MFKFYHLYYLKSINDSATVNFDREIGVKFRVQYTGYQVDETGSSLEYMFDIVDQASEAIFQIILTASQIQQYIRPAWRRMQMHKMIVHNIDDIYDT